MLKVNWDVEELVALIDVYRRSSTSDTLDVNTELQLLSKRLIMRADKLGIAHDEKYRNHNGMKMMFQNVIYVATNGDHGLPAASMRLKKLYSLLVTNPEVFDMILSDFNRNF